MTKRLVNKFTKTCSQHVLIESNRMDSALEQQRLYHEEIERINRACVDELSNISKSVCEST